MVADRFPELSELSIEEKRDLVSDLCEEIAKHDASSPDSTIVEILEQRWQNHCADPGGAVTLEEFRKRVGRE